MSSHIKDKRVEEIFNAAKKALLEKGYNNTSMEDIISQTNLSKGGVYYYFKNKEDLFLNLLYSCTLKYHNLINLNDFIRDNNPIHTVCNYYLNYLISNVEEIDIISSVYIDTRYDLDFRNKMAQKFNGNNVFHAMKYVLDNCKVKDEELLEKKFIFFFHIFHSLLYYKYIELVDYHSSEEEIRAMFYDIFKHVKIMN